MLSHGMLQYDTNHDGKISADDCPAPHGSERAKMWWSKVELQSQKDITPEMKAKYGKDVTGAFNGKPLVVGPHPGDGDFQMLCTKIQVHSGLSQQAAAQIAGKINADLYGKK